MAKNSNIEWTHHTFSPWRGCTKVSAGCKNCYAETLSKRNPGTLGVWGVNGTREVASESMWAEPLKWNKWAAEGTCYACGGKRTIKTKTGPRDCMTCLASGTFGEPYRARVFCASLSDVFEGENTMPPESWNVVAAARIRLFRLIQATPNLDWLLLTKRPENILSILKLMHFAASVTLHDPHFALWIEAWINGFPPTNVWLGTSAEDQEAADKRIPELLQVPAAVRFLSCEPLLGPVDFEFDTEVGILSFLQSHDFGDKPTAKIDWVIVGGESGPDARPLHPDWARRLRDQCKASGVPFLFKQWGEWLPGSQAAHFTDKQLSTIPCQSVLSCGLETFHFRTGKKAAGRLLDGVKHDEFPRVGVTR